MRESLANTTPTNSARLSAAQRPPVAQVRLRWRGTVVLRRHELPTHGAPPFAHSCRPLTLSSATPRNFPVEGTKRREQRPRLSSEGSRSAAHSSADVQPTASGGRQHPPQGVGLDCSVPALAQVAPARGVAIRSNSVHSQISCSWTLLPVIRSSRQLTATSPGRWSQDRPATE